MRWSRWPALAAAVLLALLPAPALAQAHPSRGWTGTWATAQHASYDPGTSEVSVRIPVHVSASGTSVRIRLTNGFTTDPLTIGHATIGRRAGGADVVAPRRLAFGGKDEVTIPAGEQAASDPARLAVPAGGDLVVSLYFPGRLTHISQHWYGLQAVYWTPDGGGDHAADRAGDAFSVTDSTFPFLTGVDVRGGPARGAVVALGDSITDGAASTANANRRWPDHLAARLAECTTPAGVLNAGISGNQVTAGVDGNPSALDRLDQDVLSQPGARAVIVAEGVNDLIRETATADRLIDGLTEIARRAHERGLRAIGATIVPYHGYGDHWTEAKEAERAKVNAFVRDSGGVFDAVADFDRAVRDPDDPTRYDADFDSGDHLHPNDTGLKALADSIGLSTLGAAAGCPAARVRLTPYRPELRPGQGTDVTATVTATGPSAITNLRSRLDLPPGWTAHTLTPGSRTLEPAESTTVTWTVTPPTDATWGTRQIGVTSSFRQGGRVRHTTDGVDATVVPVPTGVRAPYLTVSTAPDAQYAQNGGQFAIWAEGQDLAGWKDEKAAVYLPGGAPASSSVTARVVSQTGSGPAAKSGIAVADDLTDPGKGGYAVLTMSAQYGVEFMTDSDGDGRLDTWAGGGASYHPAWLRLTRDGTTCTAYASTDGTHWQQVGTADVPSSSSGTEDAGLIASAVNLNYPGATVRSVFDHFTVS
ncbi:GDSL-type esterase/lipase family protein [Streptomyces sp. NPDC097610]|uniref:GDSL-type esterase/lipase family protein n=1 Tax=Streptomyces sp. NPDC097610 TaxID=3157227 RepID=UPI00332375F8